PVIENRDRDLCIGRRPGRRTDKDKSRRGYEFAQESFGTGAELMNNKEVAALFWSFTDKRDKLAIRRKTKPAPNVLDDLYRGAPLDRDQIDITCQIKSTLVP